jgi:hypothetical protein
MSAHLAVSHADEPPSGVVPITESADLDGDRMADTIISLPSGGGLGDGEEVGKVIVHSSQGGQVEINGGAAGDYFGSAVADVGDINGDGYHDLLIGAPGAANGRGRAFVFHGPFDAQENASLSISDAGMVFAPPHEGEIEFGTAVRPVTSANCDPFPDLAIGGYIIDAGGANIGFVTYVISGFDGSSLYRIVDGPLDPWHEQAGDSDGDGDVDHADNYVVTRNQGLQLPTLTRRDGDFDGDADVDATDLAAVQSNWGYNHFGGISACVPGCPPNPPQGYHCVERCWGDFVVVPINVWPECRPIMCPTARFPTSGGVGHRGCHPCLPRNHGQRAVGSARRRRAHRDSRSHRQHVPFPRH